MLGWRGLVCPEVNRVLTALLAALLLFGDAAAVERPMEEAKLERLRATIATLRDNLHQTRDRYDRTRNEIRDAERHISDLSKSLRQIDTRIESQRGRVEQLERKRQRLRGSVAEQREQLARQVRAAYATGRQEYLRLLLNQEDPSTVARMVTYYDFISQARAERIVALKATLKEVQDVRAALDQETKRLEGLRVERSGEKEKFEEVRRERSVLLVKLQNDISSKDQRLAELMADARDLESVVAALREAVDERIPDQQPFKRLQGKLAWPARGPLEARFGGPRAQGKLRWDGVLIRAGQGQEVRAVSRGRVAFAEWLRGYGLLLVIDHGEGYMSLYGHNQSLFKETGDWVEANEPVATVGDSGGQEREALYFEIRHNGKPLDPAKWCKRQL